MINVFINDFFNMFYSTKSDFFSDSKYGLFFFLSWTFLGFFVIRPDPRNFEMYNNSNYYVTGNLLLSSGIL
jgi:hypothetical protein